MPFAPPPPNLFSKVCTRIAASAATKSRDLWLSRAAASRPRKIKVRSASINEIHPLFALHGRRSRPLGRRSPESSVRFLPRKRLPQSVHAVQRDEPALARGSEARHRTGAGTRRHVRSAARG